MDIYQNINQKIVAGNRMPIALTSYDGHGELEISVNKSILPLLESISSDMTNICIVLEGEFTKNIKYKNRNTKPLSKAGHWRMRARVGNQYPTLQDFGDELNLGLYYRSEYNDDKDCYLSEFINWGNTDNWRPNYISVRATIRYGTNYERTYIYSNVVRIYL